MLGIRNVLDLVEHYPRRYLDRTKQSDIADLRVGEEATVYAEVRKMSSRRTRQGRALVETIVYDGTSYLYVTFFNQPWRAQQLPVGTEARLLREARALPGQAPDDEPGRRRPRPDRREDRRDRPDLPPVGEGRRLHLAAAEARGRGARRAGELDDPVARRDARAPELCDRTRAYNGIHQPGDRGRPLPSRPAG